ncbi:hypothetical protein [Erwinia sp. E_sp_B04_7]|uniref:hypothetical protein n=1 Tax=unclassified Erwinia TaxID=2622719 RepID=UPI0030D11AF9
MVTIICKPGREHGTSRSRYKARRAEIVAQRRQDQQLARKIAAELTGCSQRVFKSVRVE